MGADLQYTCLGGNQYRITLRFYRDCEGIGAPFSATVNISAPGCPGATNINLTLNRNTAVSCPPGSSNGCEVSQLCQSQLSQSACNYTGIGIAPYPGVQVHEYTGVVTLPAACSNWRIRFLECCRNNAINNLVNPSSNDLSIEAVINNQIDPATGSSYCNNSVAFSGLPVPFVCANSDVTYNHGAVDADGDSLVYSLINPLGTSFAPMTFSSGWSVNNPIRTNPPNSFQFNNTNGQMSFTPQGQEVDVLAVRVDEYRNGVLVGSTIRDIQVSVLNCPIAIPEQEPITNLQNGNQVDSLTVQVCPGTPLQFDILCTDPSNNTLTITSNINATPSAIPGATMIQVGTGDTVTARIQWTPLPGDTGCHDFVLTAKNDDCPINGTRTRVYTICVYTRVQLISASPTFCGTPVQLRASGGTNFTWIPSTGPNAVSNPNIYNPTVSPVDDSTVYYFTSDCGTDSVLVRSEPPFVYDAGPGGTICQNGQVNLNATTDNLYAPYEFEWVTSNGLFDPVTGSPPPLTDDTMRIPNPVASPLVTTVYKCYITGTNGCTNVDSVLVTVSGSGPNVVAQAQPRDVCPGDQVQLNIVANPQSCGLNSIPCQGHPAQAQIGTGAGVTPTGSPTQYPTIYGHYSNSARHQFLYRQSELLAQIGSGGVIDSIAFYIAQINTPNDTMQDFEIKMTCTQQTDLSGWQNSDLVTVFSRKNVPVGNTLGWKFHRLDFPYDWDGTSNLVIDICFNNSNTPGLNNKMQMTPTSFNSVYYSKGSTSQCGFTGNAQTSVNRPNTRFHVCVTDVAGLPISWTPATGTEAPVPTNIVNPVAYPQNPVIYRVDVTALNGCHTQDFIYVNVDTSARFAAFPNDTFFCSVSPLNLSTSTSGNPLPGNTFAYQFLNLNTNTVIYSGGQNNFTVSPTTSTDYLVTLTGAACTLRDTIHVLVGNNIPINFVTDSIDCFGQSNGKIVAIPIGGIPPIDYSWSNGGGVDSIQNLAPGTYILSISDSQGCIGLDSVTLAEPPLLVVSAAIQNILCSGTNTGSINLTVSGGTPGYTYIWNPAQSNSSNATGLIQGNYSTTVTDAFGCSASVSASITEPSPLTVSSISYNATSFGGNEGWAYVIANGGTPGYSYAWSNASNNDTISNLTAGSYYVTVCDANNCCRFDTVLVTDPPPIILSFVTINNLCFGGCSGTASVSASGGIAPYIFVWSEGTNGSNISNLCAGVYTVTATDSAGVSVAGNVNITQPSQILIRLDTTDITCFGANDGAVLAIASGGTPGYLYAWSPGGSVNPNTALSPGVYSVLATDANNCTAQASWTAIEPSQLTVSISSTTDVSCYGGNDGTASANVSGGTPGYDYAWSGVTSISSTAPGFNAGNHSVTITDSHYCIATASFTITEPTQLIVQVTSTTNVSCNGGLTGAVDITSGGGTIAYTYYWSNMSATEDLNGVAAGIYSLTLTDSKNCTATVNTAITEPSAIVLTFSHTDPLCSGDANGFATVTANGGTPGYSYDWSYTVSANDNATLTNLPSGIYDVLVADASSCTVIGSVTLINPVSLNAQLINKEEISCSNAQDGSIEVTANGGTPPISFIWSNNSTSSIISNLASGIYSVTVEDNNGCDTTLSVTFVSPPVISIDLVSIDSASCPDYADGSIRVSAIGGTPGASVPYEYSIDGVNFQSSEFFTELGAGVYRLRIRDSEGCVKDTSVLIAEPVRPTLTILPQDSMLDLGQSITLISNLSYYSSADVNFYSWSPLTGLDCADCSNVLATPYQHTVYTLTVNYLSDCSVLQTVSVLVGNGEDFFVPTAFSPNGDGNNDVFKVYGSGLSKVNMQVFNRWGEKVFDTSNQWLGWDGSYKGIVQNPGVYTYSVEALYLNGKLAQKNGSLTLIR